MYSVEVLLSTYNGEKYIAEQLNSILHQTMPNIHISIHDDGSSDNTVNIIEDFVKKHDNITFYGSDRLGYPECFFWLMKNHKEAKYYAFSDQDDFWLPEKLEMAVKNIEAKNEFLNNATLYYSKKIIVDENLKRLDWYDPDQQEGLENALLKLNQASGCTMVFNRPLMDKLNTYHPNVPYHDSWVYKVATLVGGVVSDNKAYILYRQHTENVDGAHVDGAKLLFKRIRGIDFTLKKYRKKNDYASQLLDGYGHQCNKKDKKLIEDIINAHKSIKARLRLLISSGLSKEPFYEFLWIKFRIAMGWI